jgi:hypothetical protein
MAWKELRYACSPQANDGTMKPMHEYWNKLRNERQGRRVGPWPTARRRPGFKPFLALLILNAPIVASARGVTPYLPLNLSPEIERQIERVLILGDKPVMARPIAAATVMDALPRACKKDPALCHRVRRYLSRYMNTRGLTHASAEIAAARKSSRTVPNSRGMSEDSVWDVSASAYYQPSDYAMLTVGGIAYDGEAMPSGTMFSVGNEHAQLDIGFREHWLSPMTDGAMLIGTQARTMPSVTLSNYTPMTRLGLQYQVFLAMMDKSNRIATNSGFTSGHPRLAGVQIEIEPVRGWALSANRIMQFGGGSRGGNSVREIWRAFVNPKQTDNNSGQLTNNQEFGNQAAALSSRFIFPGRTPFSVYFEYAGEDTSFSGGFRLGNAALSAGIDFPRLWDRFNFTYELSEWQNAWYVHHIYLDGLSNRGHVIGMWGADERIFGDGVGAQSHMLRLGWEPGFGGMLEVHYRTVANQSYSPGYQREHELGVRYSRPRGRYTVGGEITGGRDVFGDNFGRIAAFVRFAEEESRSSYSVADDEDEGRTPEVERFVDVGLNASSLNINLATGSGVLAKTGTKFGPHAGLGVRRAVSKHNDLGARVELDEIDSHGLIAVRAIDYRYRLNRTLALTGFLGAARYDLATPAFGYYVGLGAQWRDVLPGWDANIDFRYGDKIARDKLLPSDPPAVGPAARNDEFYDIRGATLYLSYKF